MKIYYILELLYTCKWIVQMACMVCFCALHALLKYMLCSVNTEQIVHIEQRISEDGKPNVILLVSPRKSE